jgi:hypothetical protein
MRRGNLRLQRQAKRRARMRKISSLRHSVDQSRGRIRFWMCERPLLMNRTDEILIKGWSSSRIAEYLDVSLITIQELLENGPEQLKRKLGEPRYSASAT